MTSLVVTSPPLSSLRLCDEFDNTAGLGDLLLGQLADPPRAHDERDLRDAALAKDLGVAEREEIDNGGGVALLAGNVFVAGLLGDKRPELGLSVCSLV